MRITLCCWLVGLLLLNGCRTDALLTQTPIPVNCNSATPLTDTVVLLVMGQSNAANAGQTGYTSHCYNTFNFGNDSLRPLSDPLTGANGAGGTVWSRLGDMIIEANYAKTVIVAPCAIGGTKIEQWVPGGTYNALIQVAVANLQKAGLQPTHVLWHQGESNHVRFSGGISAADNAALYTENFDKLRNYLRSLGVNAPIYVAIATLCQSQPDTALQAAQYALANPAMGVYNGPNTDSMGSNYRYDNCHFNDAGLKHHAQLWLKAIWP